MANTTNSVIKSKQEELTVLLTEAQIRIKAKLYQHGMKKLVAEQTGLSKYMIREAMKSKTPDLTTLDRIGAIEKVLTKLSKSAA